jgi:hypothetical protein
MTRSLSLACFLVASPASVMAGDFESVRVTIRQTIGEATGHATW